MSLTFSFDYIDYITASLRHVQGITLLGLLRELRCHAEYSRTTSIAFRRFGLGNPHLAGVITSMTDCRMQRSSVNLLIADVSQSVLCPIQPKHLLAYMRYRDGNCTALVCATGLLFNQFRLHPHVRLSVLPFSRSVAVGWLMASPTCYTPPRVSLWDKSDDSRSYFHRTLT